MTAQAGEPGSERGGTALLLGVLAAAVAFRLWLLAWADFPINDGALFLEFVRGTAASFPALPVTIAYNGFTLPFAYPPLAFWLGALLERAGAEGLQIVRAVPILTNALYVLLIALLLLKSGRTRLFTALALLFFCFRIRSFEWLVMGGGLSRGFGSIFLIGTLLAVTVPGSDGRRRLPVWRAVLGGACVAGAILSHLEWGVLAAASLVASRALGARNLREFTIESIVSGGTAILLVLPWFLFIYQAHGLEPFMAASGTSSWNFLTSLGSLARLSLPAVANPFILLGAIVLLFKRDLFWFAFVLLCVFLTPRHAPTPLALPLAVFAAQGALTAYSLSSRFITRKAAAMAAVAGALVLILALNSYREYRTSADYFRPLPPETRDAMAWAARHHPKETFAIFTAAPWYYDASAEWFPTVTPATSVTTVQGREWLPNEAFGRTQTLGNRLKDSRTCAEVHERLRPFRGAAFVWAETMPHCFARPAFAPVFRNSRVTIFRAERPAG